MKKYFPAIVLLTLAVGITLSSKGLTTKVSALLGLQKNSNGREIASGAQRPNYIQATGFEYAQLIRENVAQAKVFDNVPNATIGITSHHLPTAADMISSLYKTLKQTPGPRQTFIIVGPDHTERCKNFISTTDRPYLTPFGPLQPNTGIIDSLVSSGAASLNNTCFEGEHSIGIHTLYIKYLFPDANIVPITLSSAAGDDQVQNLAQHLSTYKEKVTVVMSVDFSHYRSTAVANQLDADSGEMIQELDGRGLTLDHMDSPPSIKTAIALAKLWSLKPQMLWHANSYEFNGQSENTTGYWDVLFTP